MVPAAAMNQAPDPHDPEQPEKDARGGSAPLQPAASSGPTGGMPQTPSLPQLLQNAAKLLDKNIFTVSTPNPLLPSPASLQLAQLQAQLTLHRLKLAQTAVTNNTAAATVLNQVLSKVAMSQPLFNQLRHPSVLNTSQGHAGGVTSPRFPPGGLHFPTQNPTLAAPTGTLGPVGNLQNQNPNTVVINPFGGVISQTAGQQAVVMGLNKAGFSSATGGFYDYHKQVFPSDAEQCGQHGFATSGSHSVPTSSGSGTYDGHFGKHDNQLGFQKEFYGATSKGQHTTGIQPLTFSGDSHNSQQIITQKSEAGSVIHETEANNQWENPSTFSNQNKPDIVPSASMWPSTSVPYEIRNDLYNPEEPTPDTKFSAGTPLVFSRAKSSKQNFSSSRMRQQQEPVTSDLPVRPLQSHELNDFNCLAPLCFPHICTLCDKKIFDIKDWDQHIKGNLHMQKCMALSENTDVRCMLSSAEGMLHSSSPNNTSVFHLSGTEDYSLNPGSAYNSAFGQTCSAFSSVAPGVNLPEKKCTPGRVVHICNLPEGSCTENDVINLGLPFGKVTNYILMKSTNQAFLEMAYTEAAQAMVQYYKEKPAMINDEKLLIRMSKRYKELQLKKPGKNVAAIIQDIHSQRERDMLREADRYGPERPRSRSPISRSLSPRSHTPSFTSCSSPRSPLSTNRADWGNGRDTWEQSSFSRREEEREVLPWRENGEDKRDRTDSWVHEKKQHYLRHLDKLDLEERVEGTRGHREKYFRGCSPNSKGTHNLPGHKIREEDYYRKPSRQKSDKYQKQTLDTTSKYKRKEETKLREHKHSHSEDTAKEAAAEQKSSKMSDNIKQKQSDKEKVKDIDKKSEEEVSCAAEKVGMKQGKENENEVENKDFHMENSPFPANKQMKETEDSVENSRKEKDWESGSEMEAEMWYPANMEELVTVDEVGEDDLIMEPDITELEEIVTVGQKDQECPIRSALATTLEVKNEHSILNRSEDKSKEMEPALVSEEGKMENLSGSESDNAPIKAAYLNLDTEQKPHESHEGISPDCCNKEIKINENTDSNLKQKEQCISSGPLKEELFQQNDTVIDDYQAVKSLESESGKAVELLAKNTQEETSFGNQEHQRIQDCTYREMKTPNFPEVESKRSYFSPSWEQEDVFTELSIPLGVEFVVPRTGFYCKLCGLFYTNEEAAKTRHCRSTVHYRNLQKYLSQLAEENLKMSEKESSLTQEDIGIVPHFEEKKL